jgi:electron transfer flavoprotein alpha subunit
MPQETNASRIPADLCTAQTVVALGAGVRNARDCRLCFELAAQLGAAVAGTRPAMDAGWIDETQMIGQTGVRVAPQRYIAVGVSGAFQHAIGVGASAEIFAINADANAPIMQQADHAILGRIEDILPHLLTALRGGASLAEAFAAYQDLQHRHQPVSQEARDG